MSDQERELKVLLTKENYEKLCTLIPCDEQRLQINTYYDTPDQALKARGFACRIRETQGKYILTIKKPLDSITKYEYEKEVSAPTVSELDPEDRSWMLEKISLGDIELHPFVTFETIRRITQLENAELSLDETHFPKHTDYEIEYEYRKDHNGISVFNQILERAGLQYEKNCMSKLARAVQDLV